MRRFLALGLLAPALLLAVGASALGAAPAGAAPGDPCPGRHNATIYPASQSPYSGVDANGNDIVCFNLKTGTYRDDR